VAAITDQVLNHNVGAVGLEGDAIVAVVNVRVLNNYVIGTVRVPAIGVLGRVLALATAEDVDVVENDVARVGNERVPLRAVSEFQIGYGGTFCADETEEDRPQDVDVLGIQVVPGLAVSV
jgi:hypothetical protein